MEKFSRRCRWAWRDRKVALCGRLEGASRKSRPARRRHRRRKQQQQQQQQQVATRRASPAEWAACEAAGRGQTGHQTLVEAAPADVAEPVWRPTMRTRRSSAAIAVIVDSSRVNNNCAARGRLERAANYLGSWRRRKQQVARSGGRLPAHLEAPTLAEPMKRALSHGVTPPTSGPRQSGQSRRLSGVPANP